MDKQIFNLQAALERVEGDKEFLKQLIELFKSKIYQQLAELKEAYEEKNYIKVSQIAHTIKGALLNLGAEIAADEALRIEKAFKQGNVTSLDSLDERVREFLNAVMEVSL
jgi:HPt (histidine-containing phosphotransfer) domain-containing protein